MLRCISRAVTFQVSLTDGRDLSDDELEALTSTLTRRQAEAVKRRINTLSTTMRKKRGATKMHVKDIFPTPDNSSPVSNNNNNNNNNNNCIQRRNSSFFFYNLLTVLQTISNTYTQVARAPSCANHVQHIERLSCAICRVTCHMVRRDSSAIKFDRVEIAFI